MKEPLKALIAFLAFDLNESRAILRPRVVPALRNRRRILGHVLDLQQGADEALLYSDNTFDAVPCVDAANHLLERRQVLRAP